MCFDTTPPDKLDYMQDYKEVLELYMGQRAFSRAFYLGDYSHRGIDNITDIVICGWFGKDYLVYDREGEYTRYQISEQL